MKKIFFIILIFISVFVLTACDSRTKLSKNKCNEIYNYINENFNVSQEKDYLYYDYSKELLLINKNGQLYSNKEINFFENYDYNKYIYDIQSIINNSKPLNITGYKIHSQVEYMINVEYDYKLIEEETNLKINNYTLSLYKNLNIGIEMKISNTEMVTYSIGIIIGNIELSKYNQFDIKNIILNNQ